MSKIQFDSLIEGYFSYLKDIKRLAHRTVTDIKCTFKKVEEAIKDIRPGYKMWELSLDDYLQWMEIERKNGKSPHSINKEISHIRGLLEYAWRNGRVDRNVLEGFFLKDARNIKAPEVLTIDEVNNLLQVCDQKTKQERYNRLIILILYGCGLRTGELCALDVQDIDKERQEIFVRLGKGEIQRRVPVPGGVWIELLAYLSERGGKRGPLFKTAIKKKRISTKNVRDVVREKSKQAKLNKKVTPKVLRHTFASHLMDSGVDIAIISSLMGHSTPRETGIYLHAFKNKKDAAVDKLSSQKQTEEE